MRVIKATTISIFAVSLLAGSAIGVAAQDGQSMEPAEVTGRATFVEGLLAEPVMSETPEGIQAGDGLATVHTWETNDARLNGDVTRTVNFRFDSSFSSGIESSVMELTKDGGSWVGDERGYRGLTGSGGFTVLSGRGGYEGLTAYIIRGPNEGDGWDLNGIIFPAAMPPLPEPYVVE